MRDIPHVLIIEKSRFPAHIKVEECERVGKTPDNKNAIIRYQRRADVGVVKQIGRFFSDLFNGVTRAKGIVCDKPELPATLHIRGNRFNITKDADSIKALVVAPDGQARQQAALPALKIEVHEVQAHEVRLRKAPPALAHKVAEELRDRFEAAGKATDRVAVEYFLALDAEPNAEMTAMRVAQLLQFGDALGRMSGTLSKELGADVLAHVLDRMQQWQDRIAKMEVQGPGGPAPAYPGFRFKGLSAFATKSVDTMPVRAAPAPAQRAAAPEAMPIPMPPARPAPIMQPGVAEALHQPQVQPQPQTQPQPQLQPQAQVQVQPWVQPLPEAQPQFHAQPQPEVQPLPPVEPLPDLQPKPQVQPRLQAQHQPEVQAQPEPEAQPLTQAKSQTQAPAPEPALAPPPPPPPPPPAIKPAANTAAPSAGPDANELASAASRLKPTATNGPKTKAPAAKDDSLFGILTSAMAGRRADLNEDANNKQNDNDDDWN